MNEASYLHLRNLKKEYKIVSNVLNSKDLDQYAWAYILFICGSILFTSLNGNKEVVIYLQLLRDFEEARRFALAATCLSYLQHFVIVKGGRNSKHTIYDNLLLLQVRQLFH